MSACSKVIIFGEHSVVYGKKALAVALVKNRIKIKLIDNKIFESEHVKFIKEFIESKYDVPKKYIQIESNIPISSGLGSSASLSIAIAREYKKINPNIDIKNIADNAEKKAHINPSGIDVNCILKEKNIIFQKEKEVEEINTKLGIYLVVTSSGEKSSTKKAVEYVKKQNNTTIIEELGEISKKGIDAFIKNNIFDLVKYVKKSQKKLEELNLSTKKINEIIKYASYNSLASKITGAGLGGSVISFVYDKKNLNKFIKKFRKKGIEILWIEKI